MIAEWQRQMELSREWNLTRRHQLATSFGLAIFAVATFLFGLSSGLYSQGRQQVKVLPETQQSGNQSREVVQGSGSVIMQRGNTQPSGRLSATDRHTTIKRSTGIFTLVQDGGESILTMATRVPYDQIIFYRDYATGRGYITRSVALNEVGTFLKVSAAILLGNQVKVRLTPRISYFSPDRSGAIDFTEASTELVVPNGQPISLGGSTTKMHEVTRQILGFANHTSESETSLVLTATIQ